MIKKECMTTEWIKTMSVRNKYKDLNLIEKVIRAMSLLEMLKLSGCPFCSDAYFGRIRSPTIHRH